MPFWAGLAGALFSLFQQNQAIAAQREAMQRALSGGLTDRERAERRRRGEGALRTDLARRGQLDSGLLAGGRAELEGQLALEEDIARRPFQQSYIDQLLAQANRPSFAGSLVPILFQHGLRGPGGNWLIPPWQQQNPGVSITGGSGGSGGSFF